MPRIHRHRVVIIIAAAAPKHDATRLEFPTVQKLMGLEERLNDCAIRAH